MQHNFETGRNMANIACMRPAETGLYAMHVWLTPSHTTQDWLKPGPKFIISYIT